MARVVQRSFRSLKRCLRGAEATLCRVEILATRDLVVGDTSELPYEHGLDRLLEAIVIPLVEKATTEEGRDYIRFAAQVVQRLGFSGGVGTRREARHRGDRADRRVRGADV